MSEVTIIGTGRDVPRAPVPNDALARVVEASDDLQSDRRIHEGDLLCLVALGAGLNWGAAHLRL
jgi:3-oxoacyl-[acyl-carrier-protein] synthase III